MGSQIFPNFDAPSTRSGMHLVTRQSAAEPLTFELPKYTPEALQKGRSTLGCMRGVAWALGIQALFVIVIAGIWELCRLAR